MAEATHGTTVLGKPHRHTISKLHNKLMSAVKTGLNDLGLTRDPDSLAVTSGRVQIPQWFFVFLIPLIIGAVWGAAELYSDVRYLQAENIKIWEMIKTHELQLNRLPETVRKEVREDLEDANYIRVKRKGE